MKEGAELSDALTELSGKKIGVQRGSIHDRFAKEVLAPKGATIVPYGTQERNLPGRGRQAASTAPWPTPPSTSDGFLKTDAGKGFAFVGPAFTDAKYFGDGIGIAVRKGDALKDKISAAILAIRENGKYKQVQDKYFDFDIYGK